MKFSACLMTRKKGGSSNLYLQRQVKDPFVKARDEQGFVARSSFKLLEMDERFKMLKPGKKVFDLGCAPGGWVQVALSKGCDVVGCDLLDVELKEEPRFRFVKGDFTAEEVKARIAEHAPFDVFLSDAAPNYTSHGDHARLMLLATQAVEFAKEVLKKDGFMALKISRGGEEGEFKKMLQEAFKGVKFYKVRQDKKNKKHKVWFI